MAFLVEEHGLWDMQASVVSAPGLRCCVACGIFPDQGSNLCQEMLNHWTIRDAPGLYFLTLNFEIILPKSFEDNWAFLVAQLVKNPSAKKKKKRIHLQCGRPGLGRSSGEGNGYPLQYYGLVNSINCTVHGVTNRQ